MKYISFIPLLVLFAACTGTDQNADGTPMDSAQAARKDSMLNLTMPTPADLTTSVRNFLAYNKAMQFDSAANYIYPTVYRYLPKSQVVQGLSILKVLEGIEIRMDSATVVRLDSVVKFSSGEAAKLAYALKLSVAISDTGVGKQITPQVRNMIIGGLQQSLGAQNVRYNDTTKTIGAVLNRQALAINDTVSKGWKFIALENNNQLRQIVPAEIADRFLGPVPNATDSTRRDTTRRKDTAKRGF